MRTENVVDTMEDLSTFYEGLLQEINPKVLSRMNEEYVGEQYRTEAVAKVALDYIFKNREGMLYTEIDPKIQTVLQRWPYKINTKFNGDGGWIEIQSETREKSAIPKLTHASIHLSKGEHYVKTEDFKQGFDIDPESYLVTIESHVKTDTDRWYRPGTAYERSVYEIKPEVINENGFPRLVAKVRELEKDFTYREDGWPVGYVSKTSEKEVVCPGNDLIEGVIESKQSKLSELRRLSKEFPETAVMTKKIKEAAYNLRFGEVNAYDIERQGNKWFEENSKIRDEGELIDIATGISSKDIIK